MVRKKQIWLYFLLATLLVAADQWVKCWTVQNLALNESKTLIPGVVELTHIQNTGASFSILSEHTWLLAILSGLASLLVVFLILRRFFPQHLGMVALALILGGAVGNLIDRVLLGYVTDMFQLQFMNFAVFNVADTGIVVGGILLFVYVFFFWRTEKKEENA